MQSDGLLSNFVVKRNVFRWFALLAAGLVGEPSATRRLLCPTGSPVLTQTALGGGRYTAHAKLLTIVNAKQWKDSRIIYI